MRSSKTYKHTLTSGFVIATLLCFATIAIGQDSKIKPRTSLSYFKYDSEKEELRFEVKAKIEGVYEKIQGVKINFYKDSISENSLIGSETTDQSGTAKIEILSGPDLNRNRNIQKTYIASMRDNPRFADAEESLLVYTAWLELHFNESDSIKELVVNVNSPDTSWSKTPVEDVPVQIYVDRLFSPLLLNEAFETTDEEGQYKFEFPQDIPGDENGNLELIVKVPDHDQFGNLVNSADIGWGVPLEHRNLLDERALWSARSNAPIYLVIISNAILLGIWGVLVYIIIQLLKIRKLGKGHKMDIN